jgi:hypothetical protein
VQATDLILTRRVVKPRRARGGQRRGTNGSTDLPILIHVRWDVLASRRKSNKMHQPNRSRGSGSKLPRLICMAGCVLGLIGSAST